MKRRRIWRRFSKCRLAGLFFVVALGACNEGVSDSVTSTKPYSDLIGAEYRVVADDVYAYGVYRDYPSKTLTWVTLIPGVGIAGREIAFRRHVENGQIMKILGAWHRSILFENGVYYLVAIPGLDLPPDTPIRLELMRGNEGRGADLNPSFYRRLARNN
jgi:hypothetical protein